MSARDIAAGKVMIGDLMSGDDGEWQRVVNVERDGEYVHITLDGGPVYRHHPMRRVSVNRKEDRE